MAKASVGTFLGLPYVVHARPNWSQRLGYDRLVASSFSNTYRLSFIGTLIYASVIYHRHRHHKPYHRSSSHQKPTTTTTTDIERQNDKDPFPETKSSQNLTRYRDSTSAPEIDHDHTQRILGEFIPQGPEICEMGIATKDEGEEKLKIGLWDGRPRELEGEMRVHELSATRRLRDRKGEVELDGARDARGLEVLPQYKLEG
ncbi:MAG: hypothetical protein Q9188_003316 [Gyalolechia gomerana]